MRAVAVLGPTAVGKSAVALRLAERLDGEIVSVDSAQVYRGMDIGTAKPSTAERTRVPHHLIDVRDPAEPYSAAEFAADAAKAIRGIRERGRRPIVTGGTGLYFQALTEGLSPLPRAEPALRQKLDEERRRVGAQGQYERLQRVDPEAAVRLHPHDAQRVQRALEVFELTGEPLSVLQQRPRRPAVDESWLTLILEPPDRAWLHERIAERFRGMLARGLVGETWALMRRGDLDTETPAVRAVGYRQVWSYLQGECSYVRMIRAGIRATRAYAKRQLTWLRRQPGRRLRAGEEAWERVMEAVRTGDAQELPQRPGREGG